MAGIQNSSHTDKQNGSLIEPSSHKTDEEEMSVESGNVAARQTPLGIIYFSMTMTMLGIAIGISSTWPYLQKIDQNVSPTFLGWTFVSFNIAAIIGDVSFGIWLHYRPNREPLMGSTFVSILAATIFAFAQGIGGTSGLWAVLISRAFLGFTRGNMTVTRSIVSESTTVSQRSGAMASLTVAMTVGFACGSGIQALVALMGDRSIYINALNLYINLYTIPVFLLMFLGIINIGLVAYFVKPVPKISPSTKTTRETVKLDKRGTIIARCCLLLMFALVNFTLSLMESLMIPFIQHQFSLTKPKAVWYGGIIFTTQGLVGFLSQIIMIRIFLKRFTDRFLITIAYGCIVMCFVLYIPIGGARLQLQGANRNNAVNSTLQESDTGCPRKFNWCHTTPQIWLPQFVLGAFIISVGCTACISLIVSLYTKIVAAKHQTSSVSLISGCGNFGRLTAPIIATTSYVNIGPQFTFTWVSLTSSVALVAFLCLYKKMIPQFIIKDEELDEDEKEEGNLVLQPYFVTPV